MFRSLINAAKVARPESLSLVGAFRALHVSPVVMAEPMKKKKRLDPAIVRAREERKKKKLEKAIRKLEKHAKQLKPIEEMEVPYRLRTEIPMRTRKLPPMTAEELENRIETLKEWARHRGKVAIAEASWIEKMVQAQDKALQELRKESEELYQAAIQIDPELLPYRTKGCVESAPISNYEPADGYIHDVSRKWTS
ncbi:unnamed protein product [Notodromas monacha]|uniref:Large ribosomal subunit protein mL40 n=1 Tax=Notodromas monacha TaxID=399045 RepID=A0A7R9BIN8_9CRUS|nr:unnamed protein product [Notodromas monacha]CAG0914652.1 unnamed protein product [Notodromas monacha]